MTALEYIEDIAHKERFAACERYDSRMRYKSTARVKRINTAERSCARRKRCYGLRKDTAQHRKNARQCRCRSASHNHCEQSRLRYCQRIRAILIRFERLNRVSGVADPAAVYKDRGKRQRRKNERRCNGERYCRKKFSCSGRRLSVFAGAQQATYYRNIETLKRLENNSYLKTTPIQELNYTPVKDFILSETDMSQSIINKVYMMLQKTLKEAVKRKIITENPIAELKKPKTSQHREKVRALTTEEEMKLYKILTTEDVNYSHRHALPLARIARHFLSAAIDPSVVPVRRRIQNFTLRKDTGDCFVTLVTNMKRRILSK